MNLLRLLSPRGCPPEQPDCLDVYNADELRAVSAPSGASLESWSPTQAEASAEDASRFLLGLLRKRRRRGQFPAAISAGETGEYCQWLLHDRLKLGLSPRSLQNIQAAFRARPGKRVLDLYLHSPELQSRFRHGLLTAGQRKFVRWLLREGREKFDINPVEVLWFLHETAEQTPRMIVKTWLINPLWQETFPLGLTTDGSEQFIHWLRQTFEGCPGFSELKSLPLPPAPKQECQYGANVLSHFCYPSGIQQAALNIKGGLESVGWNVSCRDVPTSPITDTSDRGPFLGLEHFPITITNVAPDPHFQDMYERSGLLRRAGTYRIAYWAWELDDIPAEWVQLAPLLDEIWAPTPFVADAFRKRMPIPVYEMLPGLQLGEITPVTRSSLGIPEENYVFLFMFDMSSQMERKNPLAVIRAFRAAFPTQRDVTLVLKMSRGATRPKEFAMIQDAAREAGALVVDSVLPHAQAYGFLQMCDCFISLHRSEGFGLCLAEAMLLGKPVIATNYSGNLAFMNSRNSLLVDYALTDILEDMPTYKKGNHWAEPSIEHAVAHLKYCYENRAAAAALGAIGQAGLREKFSLEAMGRRMVTRLERIHTSGGLPP